MYTLRNKDGNVIKTTESDRKRERLLQEGWVEVTPPPKARKPKEAKK